MLGQALLFTIVPVLAAAVSGGVAAVRSPGERLTSGLQHFAAGVVFAAAAVELVPGVLDESPWIAVLGFAVGVAVVFGVRALSSRAEVRTEVRGASAGQARLPFGLLGAVAVDFLVDGLILGAGFSAARELGALLTIALAVEYLFVGLSLSATLAGRTSRLVVAAAPVVLALLTVVGTLAGVVLLDGAPSALLGAVLAFGAVAFMYLATEELLVKAHQRGETALGSVGFFVGFLVFLLLHELIA